MRIFISYARSDAPYCMELVECLHGIHEIWYDERRATQTEWRQEVGRRVRWCDVFLYLLSAESLASRFCQDEYRLAREVNRVILPVRIEAGLSPVAEFERGPVLDLSGGLSTESQRNLLNTLLLTERELPGLPTTHALTNNGNQGDAHRGPAGRQPLIALGGEPEAALAEGIQALNRGEYDNALYLLQQVQESGQATPYVDLPSLLAQTEGALQEDTQRRQAERLYPPIRELVRSAASRALGCQAFAAFQRDFPHYDPDHLAAACAPSPLANLLWQDIPAGETTISYLGRNIRYWNEGFRISQYPITHAQFQAFIAAPDGYREERWWQLSAAARAWRQSHPEPTNARFPYSDHPRDKVSWLEAIAFCAWLSELLQFNVRLPSEQQWQRAAQGNDERAYPWGPQFQVKRCNSAEARQQQTTPVDTYPAGASPFGVQDLVGNVWEWCENEARPTAEDALGDLPTRRILRGGSFLSSAQRLNIATYQTLAPGMRAATVGFRIVAPQI